MLGVDASTVSRHLAALEEAVGATLIIRGGREFAFTADGHVILEAARTMAEASRKAVTAVRAGKQEIAGTVRVSCVSSLVSMLSEVLPIARQQYPSLDIVILASQRTVDLARGEADIAIRNFRPNEPDVVLRQSVDWGWAIYASKGYVGRRGLPASPADLTTHALVLYTNTMTHLPGPRWLESRAAGARSIIRVDSTAIASQVIASGAGIGVVTCLQGDSNADLVRVFPEPVASVECYIVYHESLRGSARIRVVADILAEFLKSKEALISGRSAKSGG